MTQAAAFLEHILDLQAKKKEAGAAERVKGNQLFSQGRLLEAKEQYTLALQKYPVDAAAYSNRAMVNLKLERYDEVIADATKALEIDVNYIKAYHRRGKAHLALNQLEQALHDFEQCIARDPNDAEILDALGETCERIDR